MKYPRDPRAKSATRHDPDCARNEAMGWTTHYETEQDASWPDGVGMID